MPIFGENRTVSRLMKGNAISTTTQGAAVDLQGSIHPGHSQIKAYLAITALAGTTPSLTVKIQHSDTTTAADFTDVTSAAFTAETATTGGTPQTLHFNTTKRYVRGVATLTSDTTAATFECAIVTGNRVS